MVKHLSTFEKRLELNDVLSSKVNTWKQQRLREIPILKQDSTTRMLNVPT